MSAPSRARRPAGAAAGAVRPLLLVAALAPAAAAAERFTQADLLRRVVDLDQLTLPAPAGERSGLFSSYDRAAATVEDGRFVRWDANDDASQFLRSVDGWDVLAEMDGPGCVTRLWTSDPRGTIRIEIDGRTVIESAFEKLFDGSTPPLAEPLAYRTAPAGGCNLYFPIGYTGSCRISTRDFRSAYQVDYTSFAPGTRVDSFSPQLDDAAEAALKDVTRILTLGTDEKTVIGRRKAMTLAAQQDLKPGEKFGDAVPKGGTLRLLYVGLTDRADPVEAYAWRHCVLRIWWDGEPHPSVEAPLCDFFGSGFDRVPFRSLPIGTDQWSELLGGFTARQTFMYCYFPMPFTAGMRIEVENLSRSRLGLMLYARIERTDPPEGSLRFRARFRAERPCKVFDYAVLDAEGPGRFVGCVLNVDTPRSDWWGDGDHKVWIDDERYPAFPTLPGTGTADFLGDAPPLNLFQRPLHGVTRTASYGKSSGYRWMLGDSLTFHRAIEVRLENWHLEESHQDVDYGTMAYWYSRAASKTSLFRPLTRDELACAGFRLHGSVEIEGNVLGEDWGNVIKQRDAGVELSGEACVSISAADAVRIRIPGTRAGQARLKLRVHPRRPFETIEVADAGGAAIGTVRFARAPDGVYLVGPIDLADGETIVQVRCAKPAQLDCWVIEPAADAGRERRGP